MNSTTNLAAKRLRSPVASSASAPLDHLARTNQESKMFRELDHYFSEPMVAHRARVIARAAREELGEIDPVGLASGERLTRTKQAFRYYQQAMRIILAEYLEHDGRSIPTDTLTNAAQGAHKKGKDGGQSGGTCTTAAYVLASESFESFVELMRRLDSGPPHNGPAQPNGAPDPFGEGAVAQAPPTDWDSSFATGDRPSSRLTGDPARKGIELFNNNTKRGTAQPPRISGSSLSRCRPHAGTGGDRGDDEPSRFEPSTPPMPPMPLLGQAACTAADPSATTSIPSYPSSIDQVQPFAPSDCRGGRTENEGWPTNDSRRWLVKLDDEMPRGKTEGERENGVHEHSTDALSWRAPRPAARLKMGRPGGGRSYETSAVEGHRLAGVVPFQREGMAAFDGHWLDARGWFVEEDSAGWVSVPATSTTAAAGDIGGARGDHMDMGSTFDTDNAVASPRCLLDGSIGDFALGSSLKESNHSSLFASRNYSPNFHFGSSSGWSANPYDCNLYSEYGDGDDDEKDDDQSCDGSEEFFPEPDPFDPTDGGLPCLSRCLRDSCVLIVPGQ